MIFSSFNNRLPDPTFGLNEAGALDASGYRGPGFAEVSISSNSPTQVSRTISGRGVHRATGSHEWSINITYHPMLRDHFDVVSSFLESRGGRLNPFFVVVPQHSKPKDPAFATFVATNTIVVDGAHQAGDNTLMIDAAAPIVGTAKFGDFFNIVDPANVNHKKTYKVVGVETNATYHIDSSQPRTDQLRLHIQPPLTKATSAGAVIKWINPEFRVIPSGDVIEYKLNTDNLYQFQLNLEEILP